jgi:hypothetical protein
VVTGSTAASQEQLGMQSEVHWRGGVVTSGRFVRVSPLNCHWPFSPGNASRPSGVRCDHRCCRGISRIVLMCELL